MNDGVRDVVHCDLVVCLHCVDVLLRDPQCEIGKIFKCGFLIEFKDGLGFRYRALSESFIFLRRLLPRTRRFRRPSYLLALEEEEIV